MTHCQHKRFRGIAEPLIFGLILLVCATFANAQGLRWDLGAPGSAGAVTTANTGGLPQLLAQPGVTLNWCSYPANAVPCTNYATTYTSLTLATPCPNNAQIVLQGSSSCQATGDNFGEIGVYYSPNTSCGGFTCNAYTLTVNGVSTGPYLWMPPPSGLPDPGANGILYRNAPNSVRIAVAADVIALFSGSCSITTYVRGDGACAAFAFPALQGGTNTSSAFVLGGSASLSLASGSSLNLNSGSTTTLNAGGVMNLAAGTPTTALILPQSAGAAPTATGVFGFDVTALQPVFGNGSVTRKLIPLTGSTPNNNDCASFTVSGTSVSVSDQTSLPCLTASGVQAVQASSITQLGSDQSIAANTITVFLTKTVTMPSTGCPCRAFVSYGTYLSAAASGIDVVWVDDGTNGFAASQVLVTGSATQYGTSGSSFSPGTYANGANVTFSNKVVGSNSGGFTVKQNNNDGEPQESWLNVAIFTSN